MTDAQKLADDIRDRIADHPTTERLGIEVLRATGHPDLLAVRARHRDQVLTLERDTGWDARPPADLAAELVSELVGEALGTRRAAAPARGWPGARDRTGTRRAT